MTEAEALRLVCETALYWQSTPTTIEAVRVLIGDQVMDEIRADL